MTLCLEELTSVWTQMHTYCAGRCHLFPNPTLLMLFLPNVTGPFTQV
jgi:hypothetical protein